MRLLTRLMVHVNVWTMHAPPTSEIFDPWATCQRLGIEIIRKPLARGRGYTDGSHRIWVHEGLTECEERSTLCHEIVHVTQGHNGRQTPDVEELVRRVTARWLVPWPMVVAGLEEDDPLGWIAEHLCVTKDVALDRIAYATREELVLLEGASCASHAA